MAILGLGAHGPLATVGSLALAAVSSRALCAAGKCKSKMTMPKTLTHALRALEDRFKESLE